MDSKIDIWIEKYRPNSLDQIIGNPEITKRLQYIAKEGNMPNLLLCGPPGTGKTTSVLCLAREMLGLQFKNGVIELNASDDRGVDVVRESIKNFAKKSLILPPNRHKIVILDEVDSMTEAAQQALRRIMEIYSNTTRFALACNQSTKIIEPIQSRCAVIRYSKLKDDQVSWARFTAVYSCCLVYAHVHLFFETFLKQLTLIPQILKRLVDICNMENMNYTNDGMEALLFSADGDLRRAVNNLQIVAAGFKLITKENVFKVCDIPSPDLIKKMLGDCLCGKWRSAHQKAAQLLELGHSPLDIIATMRTVLKTLDAPEHVLMEYIKSVALSHMVMVKGLTSHLQLEKLLASLCKIALALRPA